jgi:poly(3-hydroxybutyrate) depolymerase
MRVSLLLCQLVLAAGCGRFGFGENELALEASLLTGVYTADVTLCVNQPAEVQYAVSRDRLPDGWTAEDLATHVAAGTVATGGKLALARCTSVTTLVDGEEVDVYLYAIATADGSGEIVSRQAADKLHPTFTLETFLSAKGRDERYWVHYPEAYYRDPAIARPTILYLHGRGGDGNDNGSTIENVRDKEELLSQYMRRSAAVMSLPFIVYAPQCNGNRYDCWAWEDSSLMGFLDESLVDLRQVAPVDETHFYVTGTSTGGEGAWRFAIHRPTLIAAAVSVASTFAPDNPVSNFYGSSICDMKSVPMWAFHASKDTLQLPSNSQNLHDMLAACSPPETPQLDLGDWTYQGQSHAGWVEVYGNTHGFRNDGTSSIYDWMLAHSRP